MRLGRSEGKCSRSDTPEHSIWGKQRGDHLGQGTWPRDLGRSWNLQEAGQRDGEEAGLAGAGRPG